MDPNNETQQFPPPPFHDQEKHMTPNIPNQRTTPPAAPMPIQAADLVSVITKFMWGLLAIVLLMVALFFTGWLKHMSTDADLESQRVLVCGQIAEMNNGKMPAACLSTDTGSRS